MAGFLKFGALVGDLLHQPHGGRGGSADTDAVRL